MVALGEWRARSCGGCHSDLHKSMSKDYVATHGPVWVEDQAVCFVCSAKEQYDRRLHEKHKDNPSFFDGRLIYAHLRTDERGNDGSPS